MEGLYAELCVAKRSGVKGARRATDYNDNELHMRRSVATEQSMDGLYAECYEVTRSGSFISSDGLYMRGRT